MATVKQIAARIAAEESGPAAWPTRAQRELGADETEVIVPSPAKKSKLPTKKISAGTIAGALTVIAAAVAGHFGIVLEPEVSSAATLLLSTIVGYLVPDSSE